MQEEGTFEERLPLSKERQTGQGKRKKQEDDNKGKSSVKIEEINAISVRMKMEISFST